MKTNAQLDSSAPTLANTMLAEVLSLYPFTLLSKDEFSELYQYNYDNSNNCQGKLLLRTLRNGSLRLSITETFDENIFNEVDLFEFESVFKFKRFMTFIVF